MAHFNHLWLDSGRSFVLIAALLTVLISKQSLQSETVFFLKKPKALMLKPFG